MDSAHCLTYGASSFSETEARGGSSVLEVSEGWRWVIITVVPLVVALISALGINKVWLKKTENHGAISTKMLDFDKVAFERMVVRQDTLESRLDKMRDDLSEQIAQNAKLTTENIHIKEANAELRQQNQTLRQSESDLKETVIRLQCQVEQLQKEVEDLKKLK